MTTTVTPGTEVEATPTTDVSSPKVFVDDAPLIAPEEVDSDALISEEQGQEDQVEGAAEPEVEGAAETETDAEKTVEPTVTTLTREQHEAELSKVRSGLDRRIAEIEKSVQQREAAFQQREAAYQQQLSQQTYTAQVAAYQQQLQEEHEARGEQPEDARRIAQAETKTMTVAYQHALRANQLEQELARRTSSEEMTNARVAARDMAVEHGVDDDDVPLLMEAKSIEAMTSIAKRLGALNKQNKELSAKRLEEVPAGGEENQLDSGGGAAGGMTDDQKLTASAAGRFNDFAEIERILSSRGQHPFR